MKKQYLKALWFIFSLIPAPFLFHYLEYGQHLTGSLLFLASVLFVLIVGFLSALVKIQYVVLINVLVAILSVVLASNFIIDDGGWFKPIGRNLAIIFTAIVFLIGQLYVRIASRLVLAKED